MNEVENVCTIVDRIHAASLRMEESARAVLRILEQMEEIEKIMEDNTNE